MKALPIILSLLWVLPTIAGAAQITPQDVGIDQHIGTQLPLDLPFRSDTDHRQHPLGDYFHARRPAILVMGYFGCPQLCTVVMNGLVESLTEIHPRVGTDFDVFFISIDPRETPDLGAAKKRGYVKLYGKPATADGWHFLTGDQDSVTALARTVGFRYRYDPETNQFAHASGFAIITPGGRISRYFYGIEYPAPELAAALALAADEREGPRVAELLLLCYHYNPITGPYGMVIWRTMQGGALLTLCGLAFFIVRSLRQEREATP
jgi:protein SCO1